MAAYRVNLALSQDNFVTSNEIFSQATQGLWGKAMGFTIQITLPLARMSLT
jgi:hypothetical protein